MENQKSIWVDKKCNCPYYGFDLLKKFSLLRESNGNQCPFYIIIDPKNPAYHPCDMEIAGKIPDWNNCKLKDSGIEKSIESYEVSSDKIISVRRVLPLEKWKRYFEWLQSYRTN